MNDAQCTAGSNGRCGAGSYEAPEPNRCHYDACYSDADCPPQTACLCGRGESDVPHRCVPATCRVDRDCPKGNYCTPSPEPCSGIEGWYCHDPRRGECVDDRDCRGSARCAFDHSTVTWRCDRGPICK